jgi:hypothetical protein
MKKVSVILVLLAMTISLSLVSCGGGGGKTPADMEKTLWSYVQKGNYDKYIDYLIDISADGENKEQMKSMKTMFTGKIQASMDEKGGLKSFEVKTVSEDETTAELAISFTYGDGSTDKQTASYKKVDGKWKKQ